MIRTGKCSAKRPHVAEPGAGVNEAGSVSACLSRHIAFVDALVTQPFLEPTRRFKRSVGHGDKLAHRFKVELRRRGSCTLPVRVVRTIRPDTIFIPYHWPGKLSANQLTIAAQDPISKIPEYKACAVRVTKAAAVPGPDA